MYLNVYWSTVPGGEKRERKSRGSGRPMKMLANTRAFIHRNLSITILQAAAAEAPIITCGEEFFLRPILQYNFPWFSQFFLIFCIFFNNSFYILCILYNFVSTGNEFFSEFSSHEEKLHIYIHRYIQRSVYIARRHTYLEKPDLYKYR